MTVTDFETIVNFRLKKLDLEIAQEIVDNNPEKYANLSHYFRVAVIRLNREERRTVPK